MINKIKFLFTAIYHRLISKTDLAQLVGVDFGDNCHFMTRAWGSEPYLISMGNNVETSSGVTFVTHDGSMKVIRNMYPEYKNADLFGRIIIGNNVFIGINATILMGTEIGNNVIVGAGSLVKGKLKSNSVYAGIPVKYICSVDEYKEKNKNIYDMTKHMSLKEKKIYLTKKYNLAINK
jgi:acetyltransferase-like isoleucine patch superfamily enzyme